MITRAASPSAWLIRLQAFLARLLKNRVLASAALFAIPLTVWGWHLREQTGQSVFSRGVVFALVWLAVAPWIIQTAYENARDFLILNKGKFQKTSRQLKEISDLIVNELVSLRHMYFSIPLVLISHAVLMGSIFADAEPSVQLWAKVTFGILFYIAGIGFWGIYKFSFIFDQIRSLPIQFMPLHPDKFGGFSFLGTFTLKGPQYFFSGALLFPLVFEIVAGVGDASRAEIIVLWLVVVLFFAFGLYGFVSPQYKIRDLISVYRYEALESADAFVQAQVRALPRLKGAKLQDAQTRLNLYAQFYQQRLHEIREWPFEWKIIWQLASTLLPPILLVIAEFSLR